jgi:hypothetical protein
MVIVASQSEKSIRDVWLAESFSTVRVSETGRSSASRATSNRPSGTAWSNASTTSAGARRMALIVTPPSDR